MESRGQGGREEEQRSRGASLQRLLTLLPLENRLYQEPGVSVFQELIFTCSPRSNITKEAQKGSLKRPGPLKG